MRRSKYKKKFWVMMALSAGIAFGIVGGAVAYLVRYSATNKQVCAQCHQELVELWTNSYGHPAASTSCHECHAKGIKLAPDRWNLLVHARDQFVPPMYLADDELTSQRCMDCHLDVLDLGYVLIKKVIKFNHRIHFQDGLECMGCHRAAAHQYLLGGTNRPSIPECMDCHYREMDGPPKDRNCQNCHEVMLAPGRMWSLTPPGSFTNDVQEQDGPKKKNDPR